MKRSPFELFFLLPKPFSSSFKSQVSYLCRERNYAPWVQATDALECFMKRIDPKYDLDAKDLEERKEVWEKVKKWVANLVMPYFKETGGFRFAGKLTEEEKHLKVHMIDFACHQLELQECLKSCREQYTEHLAGKQIDSYLLSTIKEFGRPPYWTEFGGPPYWTLLDCEKMLNGTQDNFDAKEGLDFLEYCWEGLSEMP